MRDKRRSFTTTQKNEILYQQNNLCAYCKCELDPRTTQFNHDDPWSSDGRTITQNGSAMHRDCHAVIHHNDRLLKQNDIGRPKPSKNKSNINGGISNDEYDMWDKLYGENKARELDDYIKRLKDVGKEFR
jgi:hypothetical protein